MRDKILFMWPMTSGYTDKLSACYSHIIDEEYGVLETIAKTISHKVPIEIHQPQTNLCTSWWYWLIKGHARPTPLLTTRIPQHIQPRQSQSNVRCLIYDHYSNTNKPDLIFIFYCKDKHKNNGNFVVGVVIWLCFLSHDSNAKPLWCPKGGRPSRLWFIFVGWFKIDRCCAKHKHEKGASDGYQINELS